MKKQKKFDMLLRYRKWRDFWQKTLEGRPCKLIDLETRWDMTIEKRVIFEKPKIDDLARFITEDEATLSLKSSINNRSYGFLCRIEGDNCKIQKFSSTPSHAVLLAVLDYLKASGNNTPLDGEFTTEVA